MPSPLLAQLRRRFTVELDPDGTIVVAGTFTDRPAAERWLADRAADIRRELLVERYQSAGIVVDAQLILGGTLTIRDANGKAKPPRVRLEP
jgi:hypothetical protein